MKKLFVVGLMLPFFAMAAGPGASTNQQPQAQDPEQCGRWVSTQIEICDERTVTVQKPITHCNYTMTRGYSGKIGEKITRSFDGHIECAAQFEGAWGLYTLTSQQQTTVAVQTTERFNCRLETRWVWVSGGSGRFCPVNP